MAWIILVSGILNLFLGLVVWLRDVRNKLNIIFWIFSLSTVALILLDFWFRFHPTLFVLRSSYAFAALVPLSAFFWVLEICNIEFKKLPLTTRIVVPTTGIAFFILPYIDGLVVKSIESLTLLGYRGVLGPLFPVYSLYFLTYIIGIVILLYQSRKRSTDKSYKLQIEFVLLGIYLYGFCAVLSSLIFPIFLNIFDYTMLDAPSLIFFVGFTAYAILKLHLFNIKVITTELLVFALAGFLLVRTIVADQTNDQIINGSIFLGIVIIGSFLIKSVLREVGQREKIESLAKDLEFANKGLESVNTRLEELDKMKSEFLSLATHQIRAPLTAVKGYASLILEGDYGEIPEDVRGAVKIIGQSCENLVVIVNEFLDISRIEQGRMKYTLTDFDLKTTAEEILAELKPNIEAAGLTYEFHADEGVYMVNADQGKLHQVVGNLIDNAIKYTPSGGSMKVRVAKEGDAVRFSIKDTGIGISPEDIPKLFNKFTRTKDANKQNVIGTGLGLYVAKQMIEAQGGKIWIESEGAGKGTTFIVELPQKV